MTNGPAHLNVLISGGFSGAYEKLLPEFMRTSASKSRPDPVRHRGRARRPLPRKISAARPPMW